MTHLYLTHPEVVIDPAVPVPDWGLSERGRARAEKAAQAPFMRGIRRIVSSRERKAIETAGILAKPRGIAVEIRDAMHENDRSATGFLPPPEFSRVADEFFARPHESVRGWERAVDAQSRIVAAVAAALAENPVPACFVGHGGVGTLLYCHLAGLPIDRRHDQTGGGGNYFAFDFAARAVLHAWRPIET